MAKFVMENDEVEITPIKFKAGVDAYGDFVVRANDIDLFYIDAATGTFVFYCLGDSEISELTNAGLHFNERSELVVTP